MTKIVHLASPHTGIPSARHVQAFAHPTPTTDHAPRDPVARQAAIENALSMALYFVRQPDNTAANLWAATARANRAFTLLKQASEGVGATRMKSAFYGAVCSAPSNTMGRA
jgi:hypothetical protein